MLRLVDIWFRYPGGDYVLRGFSTEFRRGELVLVTGPNGSGKTTLIMVSAGLLEPERGEVLFMERPLKRQLPWARRHIGVLFQDPEYMLFNPTVYDEIAFVPRQVSRDEEEVRERVLWAVEALGIPQDLLKRPVHRLSYGEKKLVALASVISYGPDILLLDEPLEGLSKRYRERVIELVREWASKRGPVVVALHEREEMERYASRVIELSRAPSTL